jgi:hypothetical protein
LPENSGRQEHWNWLPMAREKRTKRQIYETLFNLKGNLFLKENRRS